MLLDKNEKHLSQLNRVILIIFKIYHNKLCNWVEIAIWCI